jgi:hypothetical protein
MISSPKSTISRKDKLGRDRIVSKFILLKKNNKLKKKRGKVRTYAIPRAQEYNSKEKK